MRQVSKLKQGEARASGRFSYIFGTNTTMNGYELTMDGHVSVTETIKPNAPMDKDHQPGFTFTIRKALLHI